MGCIGLGIIGWAGGYTSCGVSPVTSGNVEVRYKWWLLLV